MTAQRNKQVVERFFSEVWNAARYESLEELFAPLIRTHQVQSEQPSTGVLQSRETLREHLSEWRRALPDLRMEVDQVLADGEWVMARWTVRGTQHGPLLGRAPTRRRLRIAAVDVYRLEAGRIVEDWVLWDRLGLLRQLTEELSAEAN